MAPLAVVLIRVGVGADAVTYTGSVISAAFGVAFAAGASPAWMVPAAVLRIACDVLDGDIAHRTQSATPRGAFLNDASDGIDDALLYGGLAMGGRVTPPLLCAVLVLGLAAELVGIACGLRTGHGRHAGPGGKADRLVLVSLAAVLAAARQFEVSAAVLAAAAGLAGVALVRRLMAGLAGMPHRDRGE